jgi:hypothetical protein
VLKEKATRNRERRDRVEQVRRRNQAKQPKMEAEIQDSIVMMDAETQQLYPIAGPFLHAKFNFF